MNPPPRPLGLSSMMQQQPMNLSQNSLAGIQPQRLQGLGSAPFAPPQPARRPGQGQIPASSATRRPEPIGFQGASNPFGQRLMPGQAVMDARQTMELQQSLLGETAARQARFAQSPTFAMPQPGEVPRTLRPAPPRYVPDQTGTPLPQQWGPEPLWNPSAFGAGVAGGARPPAGRGITPVQRGASATAWFPSTQRPEYLPDEEVQQFFPWARGGRVSLKTGGRIPRKKKGAKFI